MALAYDRIGYDRLGFGLFLAAGHDGIRFEAILEASH